MSKKREHKIRFTDTTLLESVKRNLPVDWFDRYEEECRNKALTPKSYQQITHIKNGYSLNNEHYFILQCIAEHRIKRELEFKSLALKNKKLSDQLEAA